MDFGVYQLKMYSLKRLQRIFDTVNVIFALDQAQ